MTPKVRVLVAEDSPVARELLVSILQNYTGFTGYRHRS